MPTLKFIKSRKIKTLLSIKRNEKPIEFTEDNSEEQQDEHIAEYHETIIAREKETSYPVPPTIVRDLSGIEKNIDTIRYHKRGTLETDIEKKIDSILEKNPGKKNLRKPSNVIYVVSKPQPGQVKGDWAVRSHRKIFSHHRTKQAAINKAREIARMRDATVMVQNTDGTFSNGFKPRPK